MSGRLGAKFIFNLPAHCGQQNLRNAPGLGVADKQPASLK